MLSQLRAYIESNSAKCSNSLLRLIAASIVFVVNVEGEASQVISVHFRSVARLRGFRFFAL